MPGSAALLVAFLGYSGIPGGPPPDHPPPEAATEATRMLKSTESFAILTRSFDPDEWMPRSLAAELNLQHEDLVREYEMRDAYHLASRDETLRQLESSRTFARYVLLRTAVMKTSTELKRLDRRNGGHMSRAQGTYRGIVGTARKPIVYSIGLPGFQCGSSFNLLEQRGKVWMEAAPASGSIEFQGIQPPLPVILRRELEVFVNDEQWKFQLWRKAPLLPDTEARVTYGTSSATLGFSLARDFTANLRSAYEVTSKISGERPPEHVFKVMYAARI